MEGGVALVSGASRGIGAEIARQLAESLGYLVYAGARDPGDVTGTEAIRGIELDVTDPAQIGAAGDRIESEQGQLDVLVNNAGIHSGGYGTTLEDADIDSIKTVLETNLFGALRLTQRMLPALRGSEHARIVNVSSGAGQLAEMNGGLHGYRLSKTALNALTRMVSDEEKGILVNSLCPGWVRTDMGGDSAPQSVAEGADTAVWLATLDDDGPSGGFFRNRERIPW